jgi:hypothetical protein
MVDGHNLTPEFSKSAFQQSSDFSTREFFYYKLIEAQKINDVLALPLVLYLIETLDGRSTHSLHRLVLYHSNPTAK